MLISPNIVHVYNICFGPNDIRFYAGPIVGKIIV